MAETIAELVAKITADATDLKKALAQSDKDMQAFGKKTDKETKDIANAVKTMGKSFVVIGASITAAMGLVMKSFTNAGSELHDMSLQTGISVKSLAGLKYAAEQNGGSLGTLQVAIRTMAGAITDAKDGLTTYTRAFDKLGLSVEDLKDLSPEEQFLKIGSAIADLPDPTTRAAVAMDVFGRSGTQMLPMLAEGSAGLKKMVEEGQRLSGWTPEAAKLADEFGDSLQALKTAMSGVFVAIGSNVVPALKDLVNNVTQIIAKIRDWAGEHPELVKWVGLLGTGLAVISTGIGTALLLIPKLIALYQTMTASVTLLNIASGNWITALLTGLAALGIAMAVASKDLEKYRYTVYEATTEQRGLTSELEKGYDAFKKFITAQERAVGRGRSYEETVASLKKLRDAYGDLGNAIKSKADQARYASEQAGRALDNELEKARESYNTQISYLSDLYAEKIRFLNAGADKAIKTVQDQIDAIDKQTETEDRSLQDTRDAEQKTSLERAMWTAQAKGDQEEYARLRKQLADFIAEVERRHLLDKRQDEKDALRDSIERIRQDTKSKEDALNVELLKAQQVEKDKLSATENRIKQTKIALDNALQLELSRLATELKAKEDLELAKLDATANRLKDEEKASRESYEQQLKDAQSYVSSLNSLFGQITQSSGGGIMPGMGRAPQGGAQPIATPISFDDVFFTPLAKGGIVAQPTLGMVGEAGPEAIIPLSEAGAMGGVTVNFTQPVFFDREDTMNKFVEMIRKGIQRQDRLRYGAAYSG